MFNQPSAPSDHSAAFNSLDQQLLVLSNHVHELQAGLQKSRSASIPSSIYTGVSQVVEAVQQIENDLRTFEEERLSLRALANIGAVINSSLEIDNVLQIVMDTIIRLTSAERGFLMLRNRQGELVMRIARNWEQSSVDSNEFAISRTIIYQVANASTPVLTTNAQQDPRFTGRKSVVAYNLRSIMCVPLKVKSTLIGVIYADNRIRSSLFTQKDLDLLSAFANQAAVSIENARLFASVRQSLAEVTSLKNLMDNVLASIASGVITADAQEHVVLCNRAAENIIGQPAREIVGRDLNQSIPLLAPLLLPRIAQVMRTDQPVLGLEASAHLQERGQVDLRLSLSPLKDGAQNTQGVAIVLEDLTEKNKLEAQYRLFERMVSPAVIAQLDPNSLQLGGTRREITVLFADIRGFTSYSENVPPETLVAVLNNYLAAAAEEILREEGTIDKFLGDAVMAWFNAPMPQSDHVMRAVRAARGIRRALHQLHDLLPAASHLTFGVGIHTGEAVLGLVGTERRLEYTAIGDCVNTTKRIQENSAAGQILISQQAYTQVAGQVDVVPVEPISAKGKREPLVVYQIV